MKQWRERDTMRAGVHVYMSIGVVLCSLFPDSTSPDPGEGNHEPGPIFDRHEARNFGCHTDRVCISSPHSFMTTGKQDGHPGVLWTACQCPLGPRKKYQRRKIILYSELQRVSVTSCTDRTSHTNLLDRRMRGMRSRPRERFMMIQDP